MCRVEKGLAEIPGVSGNFPYKCSINFLDLVIEQLGKMDEGGEVVDLDEKHDD